MMDAEKSADLTRTDIEQFLEMLSAERGASRHTLSAYARDLARVFAISERQ